MDYTCTPEFKSFTTELMALSMLTDHAEAFARQIPLEPIYGTPGTGGLQALLNFDGIDQLLGTQALRHPQVEMARAGQRLPAARYTWGGLEGPTGGFGNLVNTELVRRELTKGSTLILHEVEQVHQPVGDFSQRLAYELGMPVHVDAFLTPAGNQGFKHHHDTHSAFIVQTEGTKRWEIFRPAFTFPLDHRHSWNRVHLDDDARNRIENGNPDLTVQMKAGEVLWIPRGWIHNCYADHTTSLHLTLGIEETSWFRLLERLLDHLAEKEEFRRDLPSRYGASRESVQGVTNEFRKLILDWCSSGDMETFTDSLIFNYRTRLRGPRVAAVSAAIPVSSKHLPSTVHVIAERLCGIDDDGAHIAAHLGDRILTFDGTAAAVVRDLLKSDGNSVNIAALRTGREEAEVDETVRCLLEHGILTESARTWLER